MVKFKIGDKVEILDGSKIPNYTGDFTIEMRKHIGEIHTVMDIRHFPIGYGYFLNDTGCLYDERGLKLVSNHNEKIVVTTDGKTTTAKMYHGKTVVKTATAKCNPDDKFNFDKGAKIAVDRLLGVDDVSEDNDDGFKVGDIVNIVNSGLSYTTYTKWITKNVKDIEKIAHFMFKELPEENSDKYKIITIAKHGGVSIINKDCTLVYVERIGINKECYLIGVEGLKKC